MDIYPAINFMYKWASHSAPVSIHFQIFQYILFHIRTYIFHENANTFETEQKLKLQKTLINFLII